MSALDELLTKDARRGRGCAICGALPAARLIVQIRRLDALGRYQEGGDGRNAASKGLNFCEEHAIGRYADLVRLLGES